MSAVQTTARAKLNLSLDVLGVRGDGFHDLRMVMQTCTLADDVTVEMASAGDYSAQTNRAYLPTGDKNVAIKAARAYYAALGRDGGVHVKITKRIPVCAGLGGGSSDAAAVLRALNELNGHALSEEHGRHGSGRGPGRNTQLPASAARNRRGNLHASLQLLHSRALFAY